MYTVHSEKSLTLSSLKRKAKWTHEDVLQLCTLCGPRHFLGLAYLQCAKDSKIRSYTPLSERALTHSSISIHGMNQWVKLGAKFDLRLRKWLTKLLIDSFIAFLLHYLSIAPQIKSQGEHVVCCYLIPTCHRLYSNPDVPVHEQGDVYVIAWQCQGWTGTKICPSIIGVDQPLIPGCLA